MLPGNIKLGDVMVNDKHEIANNFNTYFTNIGPLLAGIIKNTVDPLLNIWHETTHLIYLTLVSKKKVTDLISF